MKNKKTKVQLEFYENTKQWTPSGVDANAKPQTLRIRLILKAGLLNAEDIDRVGNKRRHGPKMGGSEAGYSAATRNAA